MSPSTLKKSDQGGIESYLSYERHRCWNLKKSDQGGIESVRQERLDSEENRRRNQTKVGLKADGRRSGGRTHIPEEIRPRWD